MSASGLLWTGPDSWGRALASWMRATLDFSPRPSELDVRSIDLQNTTYPANSCDQDGWASSPPITVRGGEGTAGDKAADAGYAEVYGVTPAGYADLDGDGREDVVVVLGCSAGGSYGDQIVVPLRVDGDRLALLGGNIGAVSTEAEHLDLVDSYGEVRLARIMDATVDGTEIVVNETYDATGSECQGCHTGRAKVRWRWEGGRWQAALASERPAAPTPTQTPGELTWVLPQCAELEQTRQTYAVAWCDGSRAVFVAADWRSAEYKGQMWGLADSPGYWLIIGPISGGDPSVPQELIDMGVSPADADAVAAAVRAVG